MRSVNGLNPARGWMPLNLEPFAFLTINQTRYVKATVHKFFSGEKLSHDNEEKIFDAGLELI